MTGQKQSKRLSVFIIAILLLGTELFAQGINIDFGTNSRERYMRNVGNSPGSDGEVIGARFDRVTCAQGVGGAIYFDIDNEKLYERPLGTFNIINVEYYDVAQREIKLVYDSRNNAEKTHEKSIVTTGSMEWKAASFFLEDAFFANRQKNNADFRLECADTMTINIVRVAPIDLYIDFGTENEEYLLTQKSINAGDSQTEILVVDSEELIATIEENNYLYAAIDDEENFEGAFNELFVSIEYFDTNNQHTVRLQYDSTDEPYKSLEWLQCRGWQSYKTFTWEISDAWFANRQNDGADLRLNFQQPGMMINRLMIGYLDYGPSAVESKPQMVNDFNLEQNYPNPFNPTTTIHYSLKNPGYANLNIYNSNGQLVKTLVNGQHAAGNHVKVWDGTDNNGQQASSGEYIYKLQVGEFNETRKMIKLK